MSVQYHKIAPYAAAFFDEIKQACTALHLPIDDNKINALLHYLDGLLLWTKAYNLTAITKPKDALIKHILDCLAAIPAFENSLKNKGLNDNIRLLDIGTGAGLPSVIVAIMRPDWHITALDSNSKKIRFIRQMAGELGLNNITPVASRIEEFDEKFTLITSRAFASLVDFVAVSEPLLATNGILCAMKGKVPSDELAILGDWQQSVIHIQVPQLSDERCVVVLYQ